MTSIQTCIATTVAVVFGSSAIAKVSAGGFPHYLDTTGMFHPASTATVAWSVIGMELVTACLLLLPACRLLGWVCVVFLAGAFFVFHVCSAILGDIGGRRCLAVAIMRDRLWTHIAMLAVTGLLALAGVLMIRHHQHTPRTLLKARAM